LVVFLKQLAGQGRTGQDVAVLGRSLPDGQYLRPDPVAEVEALGVGPVLAVRDLQTLQSRHQFGLGQGQQGADAKGVSLAYRSRRSQAGRAAAPGQTHQEGFGDVVLLVAKPEGFDSGPAAGLGKKRQSGIASGSFAGRSPRLGLPTPGREADAQTGANGGAKSDVLPRNRPAQAVIEVHGQ
jgi:hypothetical protein